MLLEDVERDVVGIGIQAAGQQADGCQLAVALEGANSGGRGTCTPAEVHMRSAVRQAGLKLLGVSPDQCGEVNDQFGGRCNLLEILVLVFDSGPHFSTHVEIRHEESSHEILSKPGPSL